MDIRTAHPNRPVNSHLRRASVAVAITVLALTGAIVAHATPPGMNGRIAFERLRFQNSPLWGELFVANSDGTDVRRITHPPNGTEDGFPDWSVDGSQIIFTRQPPKGASSIWSVAPDGSRLRRLSPYCPPGTGIPTCPADDWGAVWSPDLKHIVFQRISGTTRPKGASVGDATAIYSIALVIADANLRHPRTLVWFGPFRGSPQFSSWSPDGKQIAFIEHNDNGTRMKPVGGRALYVVNANGAGLRRLTPWALTAGDRIDWSPDGSTILFRTHPGDDVTGLGANLYTIHPDGTGLHQLTHFAPHVRVGMGSYSPDGKSITFPTSAGAVGPGLPDVYIMNADGTDLRQLTKTRNFEASPDWGPAS